MAIFKEKISLTDEFTGLAGGGVGNLQGGVMNRMKATLDFFSFLPYLDVDLQIDLATKTITNCNQLDFRSFLDDGNALGKGLKPKRKITLTDTVSNNVEYTIDTVTERVITIIEEPTTETVEGANIFDTTKVVCADFLFNLIENLDQASFLSLTDIGAIQRFKAKGLDSGNAAPINMLVSSASFGWVTNKITNLVTGETSEVTIQGNDPGPTDFKQHFRIIQTFHISPFITAAQIEDLREIIAPDYFLDNNALKYIWEINAGADCCGVDPDHTGTIVEPTGCSNWFNQNNKRGRPDYSILSITFKDGADVEQGIDINKVIDCVITLKSKLGQFTQGGSAEPDSDFVLDFLYLPLDESQYINTPNTTLRENFINDRRFLPIDTLNDGEFFGTVNQVLTNITPVFIDASTVEVRFKVDFSAELKTFLKGLPIDNRNYLFAVTTQDAAITTTAQCDRVTSILGLAQINFDEEDPTLLEAVDNVHICTEPHLNEVACCDPNPNCNKTTVAGYEGDVFVAQFPFRVIATDVDEGFALIKNTGFQIIARKEGEVDFLLEEKIFDASFVRKLDNAQTINFSEARNLAGLRTVTTQRNLVGLGGVVIQRYIFKRDETFDKPGKAGFLFVYPFTLRYDFWAKLVEDNVRRNFPIFEDIENPTNAWNTVQQDGWSLKLRFFSEVEGFTGFVNLFEQFWDIDCKALGDAPDVGPTFESNTIFSTIDNIVVNGIQTGKKTRIVTTYTGNFEELPEGFETFLARIFVDLEDVGGVTYRRYASTEEDIGGEDSPFTAPVWDGRGTSTWASRNLRIKIFNFTKIVVETIYDDEVDDWGSRPGTILVFPRLNLMSDNCFLIDCDGLYVMSSIGQRIRINCDCESSGISS